VALVEFAIVSPLLFLVLFGMIEFGWAFFQNLDVRHGAREGARLAAVSYQEDTDPGTAGFQAPAPDVQLTQIINETCERMDSGSNILVNFHRPSGSGVGQEAHVTVRKPLDQLTGFIGFAIADITLSSTVEIRLEQPGSWTSMSAPDPDIPSTFRACPP
jgi:Flp pilus assembly protein TadG